MIRKNEARIGARVKWQSLDPAIEPARGIIVNVTADQAFILCDDGEDSDTYLDNGASCWSLEG